jgi:hypothetical protein
MRGARPHAVSPHFGMFCSERSFILLSDSEV